MRPDDMTRTAATALLADPGKNSCTIGSFCGPPRRLATALGVR